MCRLRLSRLFCLLFVLSAFFGSFGLSVSAASENLIDPNLKNWEAGGAKEILVYSKDNDIFRLGSGSVQANSLIFETPNFIAGHSYTVSFYLPDADDICSAWDTSIEQSTLINYYNNCDILIGYGFLRPDGAFTDSSVQLFHFSSDNIAKSLGKKFTTSFVAGTDTGTPCIYISLISSNDKNHLFFFQDFVMFDNDQSTQELKGIKGFLHSIRWDLVGGVCDEEDCPHSYNNNPHLSLTERMSAGFATMLDNIGNKFEEGSTLNVWFSNLSSGVTDLGDRVSGFFNGLGDRISGFFNNLGDRISGFFDKLKENVTSGFTNVGTWFTNLGTNLSTWFDGVKLKFQEVGDGIKQKFQDIADKFTEFFEKFKPRVHVNLNWVRGLVNWSTGELMLKDDTSPYVVVSELFEVPHGTKYLIDYEYTDITKALAVHKYDLSGTFISSQAYSKSLEGFELESGFKYRFRTTFTTGVTDLSVVNDYVMIYSDEGWLNALIYNLKMSIKGLFVPDEQFISEWKADMELLLQERLGIIWDSGDVFITLIQTIGDFLTTTADDIHYELPEMEIELNGNTYVLWQAQEVDFSFLKKNAFFSMLYNLYKVILNVFLGIPLLNYAKKEMDATLHN